VAVRRIERLTRLMTRVTFAGRDLEGLDIEEPAASVRLLLPKPGTGELVVPEWNGNEFLLPDGSRPVIRTFTPRRMDADALELDLDVVIHEGGAVSAWVGSAQPGAPAAISGPGRGYTIDPEAPAYLLAGDQTAIPAIAQLVESLPAGVPVDVIVEIVHPDAVVDLPEHPASHLQWVELVGGSAPGDALVPAVERRTLDPGTKVWAAGEAAAMHRLRRHLFDDRGLPRRDATVRGYWKHGR
jgi:NADPH-dependent ferric siderophore reductase